MIYISMDFNEVRTNMDIKVTLSFMKFIQQNGHNTDQTTTGKFINYILVIMYMCIPTED